MMEKRFLAVVIIVFSVFSLTACRDKEETDDYGNIMLEDDSSNANYEAGQDVPPPALAAGQILVVRLIYGVDDEDEDNEEWYEVKLSRVDSYWSDSVKIQGIGRSKVRHYDDYTFSANNFNWQVEKEQYGTDTLDGDYEIVIQGSNGYHSTHRIHWTGGTWTNASPTLTFAVR